MKHILFILFIAVASCCSSTKSQQESESDMVDGIVVPACVKKMIERFKAEEVQNPPRKIYSYQYNGKTVYYVTAPCCDFYTDLYDSKCNLIAHPDGGFTGKGDGKLPDFVKSRTNEKLIWEDKRK